MTGAEGIGGGAASYFTSLSRSAGSTSTARSLSGGEGAGGLSGGEGGTGNSASFSGFAQLLSALQQLQAQDPSQFKQVASQISNQLQGAAQQQGSSTQGDALTSLANQFQNVANTGDLSQLRLSHHKHDSGYGSNGQPTGSSSTSNSDLQKLFGDIASEVNSALGN
jgi:hypothetical protein